MKELALLLIVGGFCLGTLGAAGFDKGATRDKTELMFGGGLALLIAGGLMSRAARKSASTVADGSEQGTFTAAIERIRDQVEELDSLQLHPEDLRTRVHEVLTGTYFDLTQRHEDLIAAIGFNKYAKVWEGVANAERLLNRYWCMATDGHHEEARVEIPLALAQLERAATAIAEVETASA